MDHWDEMRTAYTVARLGTVSAAADALGLHRATVVRHIDALEGALGGRLFQRHARGYTPTEAGEDMLRIAAATDEQFRDLKGRVQGARAAVSGELVVTSIAMVAPLVLPSIARFRAAHPEVHVRYELGSRVFRLDYGEAHVAVRLGARPEHPDNVVQPWVPLQSAPYVHRDYVAAFGMPDVSTGLAGHGLVVDPRNPVSGWMAALAPRGEVVMSTANDRVAQYAVLAGLGVGFFPVNEAEQNPDLVRVCAPRPDWTMPLWIVTHVDLHRTAKVRAFTRVLRAVLDAESD